MNWWRRFPEWLGLGLRVDRERRRRHHPRRERPVVHGHELGSQLVLSRCSGDLGVETGGHRDERAIQIQMDVSLVRHQAEGGEPDDLATIQSEVNLDRGGIASKRLTVMRRHDL
jgi:hypothetical protein